jgi:hypothetical protein
MTQHLPIEQLSAYLDGDVEDRARIDAHLSSCAHCRETLAALRATLVELRDLEEEMPGEQDSWALRSAIAAARARDTRRYPRIAMAAASVAAVVVGIAFAASGRHTASKSNVPGGALGGAVASASLPNDFDEKSAQALLASAATGPVVVSNEFSADTAGNATSAGSAPQTARQGGAVATPAPQPLHMRSLRSCQAQVAPSSGGLVEQLSARFKGAQAYFFIFAVPADNPVRLELWVTSPACDVLYFAQRTVKR